MQVCGCEGEGQQEIAWWFVFRQNVGQLQLVQGGVEAFDSSRHRALDPKPASSRCVCGVHVFSSLEQSVKRN